eukprot:6183414-Pyramimonas_sp.AAC.1
MTNYANLRTNSADLVMRIARYAGLRGHPAAVVRPEGGGGGGLHQPSGGIVRGDLNGQPDGPAERFGLDAAGR